MFNIRKIGVVLIAILALVRFLYLPLINKIDVLNNQILTRQYNILRIAKDKDVKLDDNVSKIFRDYELYSSFFTKNLTVSEFQLDLMDKVKAFCEKNGVETGGFEMPDPITDKLFQDASLIVHFNGDFTKFLDMVKFLNNNVNYPLFIKDLTLSKNRGKMQIKATFNTYILDANL